ERTRIVRHVRHIWLLCVAVVLAAAGSQVTAHDRDRDQDRNDERNHNRDSNRKGRSPFVTREGSDLYLQGRPFRFAGSNNYYPIYKSPLMVRALLDKAAVSDFAVMRVWSTVVSGNQDGSNSVDGIKEGVDFHYWEGAAPASQDG